MLRLHNIHELGRRAWVWGTVTGYNERQLGERINGYAQAHLYAVERGTPPRLGGGGYRQYWSPWNVIPATESAMRTTLCGSLRTAGTPHRWGAAFYWGAVDEREACPRCRRVAEQQGITPQRMRDVQDADPWMALNYAERVNNPDPISGL